MLNEKHDAVVTATNDPERRGRIKVKSASLLGDEDSDVPIWIEPVLAWGTFVIPDVGEIVEIVIDSIDDTDETFAATSIENPRPRWYGARYYQKIDGEGHRTVPEEFKVNYGKRRGFATPQGHMVIFDDTAGSELLSVSCKVSTGTISIVMDKDGSMTLGDPLGSSIVLDGLGTVKIDGTLYTEIGGATALALAKNVQVIAAFTALGLGISGLPPGPVSDVDLKNVFTAFLSGLAGILLGTLRGGMA